MQRNQIVVYVAGPFRGKNAWEVENNIRRAEELAFKVWEMGVAAICPHCNGRFFSGTLTDSTWLDGDLEIMRRCDAVILAPGWEKSEGTAAEIKEASSKGIPIFYNVGELFEWVCERCS